MGIEPYQVSSAVYAVLAQRLVRRKTNDGYKGRLPIAEFTQLDSPLRQAILAKQDIDALTKIIHTRPDHQTLRQAAQAAVDQGVTDTAEINRVLGT
jgi:type II secretory ATPase GspE/PulE/Tfp pilus assembly ATPase PilB-like protein